MNKKQYVLSAGIIASLVLSNGIVAWQYDKDINEYDQKLENKTEQYDKLKVNYIDKVELLNGKETEFNSQIETIDDLTNKNKSLNETVTKQKEDIVKLKEQLEQVKKKVKELP